MNERMNDQLLDVKKTHDFCLRNKNVVSFIGGIKISLSCLSKLFGKVTKARSNFGASI